MSKRWIFINPIYKTNLMLYSKKSGLFYLTIREKKRTVNLCGQFSFLTNHVINVDSL